MEEGCFLENVYRYIGAVAMEIMITTSMTL